MAIKLTLDAPISVSLPVAEPRTFKHCSPIGWAAWAERAMRYARQQVTPEWHRVR